MATTAKKFNKNGMVAKKYVFARYPEYFAKWSNDHTWNWSNVSTYAELSEDFIKEFANKVDWGCVSEYQHFGENFIREFADRVDWFCISAYQHLSESFIREFADRVDWFCISAYQHLSESFIREFADKVDWDCISEYQHLSEDFIREFADRVGWNHISAYQHLSESFIREFADRVDWGCISTYQHLSESFIREFADRVDWCHISKHQVLAPGFVKEMKISICNNCLRTPGEWKTLVKSTGLYECHDDYFIAFKGIQSDRYSKFNFQYQYLPGKTYECFSDYSDEKNSFGLSAWTEEKAGEYCNELVIKVKINYEDITAVVHDGGKIRCKKLTVLS